MKKLILILVAAASTSALAYNQDAVKDAEEVLLITVDRFNVGELTRTDVAQAERYLQDMKYFAGMTSKQDYCKEALASQQVVVEGMQQEVAVGQRTVGDAIEARRELYRLQADCK